VESAGAELIADIHLDAGGNTVVTGGSASPKTMPELIAGGADSRGTAAEFQRVEDNAFHLALGALVRECFRSSKNEIIRSRHTDRV
jgi:hypothetical protein